MSKKPIALTLLAALIGFPAFGQVRAPSPLKLRDAAERALARAPESVAARAAAREADSRARFASAGFAPQAFATTTPGYSSGLPVAVAGRVPAVFGVEIHQTLYDPARRAETLEARANAEASAGISALSISSTARALVLSYARNWEDRRRIQSARRELEANEAIERRTVALAREGRKTELDVERAGLDVARAKQRLADRQSESDLDRLELAWLVDSPRGEPLEVAEDPLSALPEAGSGDHLAAALAADPELAALAQQETTLGRAASLQKHAWLPVVQAEGQYMRLSNYNNFDQYFVKFKSNDWAIGVSVAVPLWTGGRLGHGQAVADARLEKIRADRRARERDLELAVRRAEAEHTAAQSQSRLAARALAVAGDALRIQRALAEEGRAEPDSVDGAEVATAKAEEDQSLASQGLLAARVKLLELRGELAAALLVGEKRF